MNTFLKLDMKRCPGKRKTRFAGQFYFWEPAVGDVYFTGLMIFETILTNYYYI
jgi:hypothetical protein